MLDTSPGTSESSRIDPVSKTSRISFLARGVQILLFYDDKHIAGLLPSLSTSVPFHVFLHERLLFFRTGGALVARKSHTAATG